VLPNGELPRNRDHILVDVQGRPHRMMLAHHRISSHPYSSTGPTGERHSTARQPCKVVRIDFGWLHWPIGLQFAADFGGRLRRWSSNRSYGRW
jgi:hypothetical protein